MRPGTAAKSQRPTGTHSAPGRTRVTGRTSVTDCTLRAAVATGPISPTSGPTPALQARAIAWLSFQPSSSWWKMGCAWTCMPRLRRACSASGSPPSTSTFM